MYAEWLKKNASILVFISLTTNHSQMIHQYYCDVMC